jgi:hypothetical protein
MAALEIIVFVVCLGLFCVAIIQMLRSGDPIEFDPTNPDYFKPTAPTQSKPTAPTQSKTVNLDAESQKIKSDFNGVMISLGSIIFVQGIGFSTSIGSVLQDNFGISQFASFFVVLTLSLPLILILRGMQIMTNAILLNKANK